MTIKRLHIFFLSFMILLSCTPPVLNKSIMLEGDRDASFAALRENPKQHEGKLYIFGGVIVHTRLSKAGSQIEAIDVPVDGSGYFKESGQSEGRFLAILPNNEPMLDPVVYSKGRRVTLAGEFVETRNGKIDEMEYTYPVFRIRQIYLWPRERLADYPPPYYYDYDPWFYPYPYYYGYPWWFYPDYHAPQPVPPAYPRIPQPSRSPQPEQRRERQPESK